MIYNENDKAKYVERLYNNLDLPLDDLLQWWNKLLEDVKLLVKLLMNKRIRPSPTAFRCYLYTRTKKQLGQLWYLGNNLRAMSDEDKERFQATELTKELTSKVEKWSTMFIYERLVKRDCHVQDSGELRLARVPGHNHAASHCIYDRLSGNPAVTHNYACCSHLLAYVGYTTLTGLDSRNKFKALKMLG